MSLFGSIQLAANTLSATQIALQVTGNNIANANTPGYLRQEVVFTPAPTQMLGTLPLGLGVQVEAIVQKVDLFLEERLRGSVSDLANGETQEDAYLQLETIVGELSDTDLSTSLSNFFGSINDILNQPESVSVRNLASLQGQTLAADIRRLSSRVGQLRNESNDRVRESATDINRLLDQIAKLNVQVVTTEGGSTSKSDAVGIRDRRQVALSELASIIDIRALEQPNGSVTVLVGNEFVVSEGTNRTVKTVAGDQGAIEVRLEATDSTLRSTSGKLSGLIAARDQIFGGYEERLNNFSRSLIFEFNRTYSSGQGLVGYSQLTSESAVTDATLALDAAGLEFTPENGSFQVQVLNRQTGLTETTDIFVPLNGLPTDITLDGLASQLDAIDGVSAQVDVSRRLVLKSESSNLEFAFANDSSGVLAALGLNTFFSGSSAKTIDVSAVVRADPNTFAASQAGVGVDTEVAVRLADFINTPLETQNNISLADTYDRLTADFTQGAAVARSVAEGFRVFNATLEGQKLSISGVNLDEEAVSLVTLQRVYQASARYISTVSDLLDVLLTL